MAPSTAIDPAGLAGAPGTDERGIARDGTPDIGAYEYVAGGAGVVVVDTTDDYSNGDARYGDTSSIDALLLNKGTDGLVTLREAIDATNNSFGQDRIHFNIAGTGIQTISLDTALPYLTDDVALDATTQAGGSFVTPLIELVKSGSYSGGDTAAIVVRANNSVVSGFIVGGWGEEGIEVDGSTGAGDNNLIELNWVGFDSTGAASGVVGDGILVTVDADNNEIRNNVVGNSGGNGISYPSPIRMTTGSGAISSGWEPTD